MEVLPSIKCRCGKRSCSSSVPVFLLQPTGVVGMQNGASLLTHLDVQSEQKKRNTCGKPGTSVCFVTAWLNHLINTSRGTEMECPHVKTFPGHLELQFEMSGFEFEVCAAWVQLWEPAALSWVSASPWTIYSTCKRMKESKGKHFGNFYSNWTLLVIFHCLIIVLVCSWL